MYVLLKKIWKEDPFMIYLWKNMMTKQYNRPLQHDYEKPTTAYEEQMIQHGCPVILKRVKLNLYFDKLSKKRLSALKWDFQYNLIEVLSK